MSAFKTLAAKFCVTAGRVQNNILDAHINSFSTDILIKMNPKWQFLLAVFNKRSSFAISKDFAG